MCGGARRRSRLPSSRRGLSPRVRGSREHQAGMTETERSIPACAGEPSRGGPSTTSPRVYPRVCGGALRFTLDLIEVLGLSPRVRGSLGRSIGRHHTLGSIPACAGEPPEARLPTSLHRVYPRVCGGARGARRTGLPWVRSIPACAGEPPPAARHRRGHGVYPRVCGGAVGRHSPPPKRWGLSPRVRGSLPRRPRVEVGPGSIPACAGEPTRSRPCGGPRRVYPRVCGGSRSDAVSHRSPPGSIPACAGEPATGTST